MDSWRPYTHSGFWQPMDTLREKNLLEDLWATGKAPWKVWYLQPGQEATPSPAFWAGKKSCCSQDTLASKQLAGHVAAPAGSRCGGLALPPATTPNLFELANIGKQVDSRTVDIRNADQVAKHLQQINPDVVLHLAAQALVRESYRAPVDTFATNVLGTAHVLDAVRHCNRTRTVVAVTTDKVYQNNEWHHPYRESDALGGHGPLQRQQGGV